MWFDRSCVQSLTATRTGILPVATEIEGAFNKALIEAAFNNNGGEEENRQGSHHQWLFTLFIVIFAELASDWIQNVHRNILILMFTPKIVWVPHLLPAPPGSLHHLCSFRCSGCCSDSQTLYVHMIKPWRHRDSTTLRCRQHAEICTRSFGMKQETGCNRTNFPKFQPVAQISILEIKQISMLEN